MEADAWASLGHQTRGAPHNPGSGNTREVRVEEALELPEQAGNPKRVYMCGGDSGGACGGKLESRETPVEQVGEGVENAGMSSLLWPKVLQASAC